MNQAIGYYGTGTYIVTSSVPFHFVAFQLKVLKPKIASFFSGNPTNAMYATSPLGSKQKFCNDKFFSTLRTIRNYLFLAYYDHVC
jgi:hypothetical protein